MDYKIDRFNKFTILEFNELDSTNEEAKRGALELNNFSVIIAKTQNAGRGRMDRVWESNKGNLFASLLIKAASESHLQNIIMSLSIQKAVKGSVIKWPNDVLFNDKKFAGILSEKQGSNVILGFGVNITNHPAQTNYPATNLKAEGIKLEFNALLKNILLNYSKISILEQEEIIKNYKANLGFIDKEIIITLPDLKLPCIIKDIDEVGNLIVEDQNKNIRIITFGDVNVC